MINFREAQQGDEEGVLKVVREVLSGYGLEFNPEEEDLDVTNLKKYYMNNKGWFQVILEDDRIIGSTGIFKVDETTCELRKMYLLPSYQGKGLGKKLMENALEVAKALGYKTITLQTNSVLVKALPLYERFGFRQEKGIEVCSRCDLFMKKVL